MSEPSPTTGNVIAFLPRRSVARGERPLTPATIMMREFWDRLGETDLSTDAVQSAVNGIIGEIVRQARAEGDLLATKRLSGEIAHLRGEIARRDAEHGPQLTSVVVDRGAAL